VSATYLPAAGRVKYDKNQPENKTLVGFSSIQKINGVYEKGLSHSINEL